MLAATPKDHSSFRKSDSKIVCIIWSRGISDFDANFGSILRILAPKPGGKGGVNTLRKDPKPTLVSLQVAWCILHFGLVSLKSV